MPILHGLPVFFLLLLCLSPLQVAATELSARFARIHGEPGTLEQVRVELDWPQGASEGHLRIRAAKLDFPALSYKASDVDWQCPLRRDGRDGWRCAGKARVSGTADMPLSLSLSPAMIEAELRVGDTKLAFEAPSASPEIKRIRIERLPIAWMKAFLAGLWQEGNWTQGDLGGRVDLIAPARGPLRVEAEIKMENIGLETPSGWLAAAGLKGELRLDYREQGKRQDLRLGLELRGGELLAQSLYAVLPTTPVQVRINAENAGDGRWRLPEIGWQDGEVLAAGGSATFAADSSLSELDLDLQAGDLAVARDRYLSGLLAPAGFADLVLGGGMRSQIQLRDGQLASFGVELARVNAIDSKARFTFGGLDGALRWTRDAVPVASALRWDSGAIYGIGLDAANFPFVSSQGRLQTENAVAIPVLGGRLILERLRWQPPSDEQGTRFELSATMDALDMASLSQRLGWPPFTGSLGGRIPAARYADNVLTLDGGLQMSLFGGSVKLSDLVMERPFGIAPTLSADVAIEDIDLEGMTRAFDFGSIAGRMDGHIRDLRMVDWSPAAFDAKLYTDPDWKGKRRISQRAVRDISDVAGSGMLAGLQAKVLKVFDDFGYEQIGLGCTLKENVCRMDGVGSAGDGYIIVAGAGLPRIQVVGFRRSVDWPTLVSRLEAVTAGQGPVIE